jgi:aryl-alcohol dehydrogenase-like predicted oxidoreductase
VGVEYRNVGDSGLVVSRIVFGGSHVGESLDSEATRRIVHKAWDLGVNTFYTADSYASGQAEVVLGEAIRSRRDELVLMVKAGYRVGDLTQAEIAAPTSGAPVDHYAQWLEGIAPSSRGMSRKHLVAAIDASLKRLGTDYIDLYQIHFWDPHTPIEETLDVLDNLVASGKVRYIGCSQSTAWQLYRALWVSEVKGFQRFQSIQARYNIFERHRQGDLLTAAAAAKVSVFAYSSLAGSLLSNTAVLDDKPTDLRSRQRYADMYWSAENIDTARALRDLAGSLGDTVAHLAQGWALAQPAVTSLLIGPSTPEELASEVDAIRKPLSIDELAEIDRLLAVRSE